MSGPTGEVPDKLRTATTPPAPGGKGFVREATGLVRTFSAWDSLSMNFVFMAVGCLFLCYSVVGIYVGANVPVGILITTLASFLIAKIGDTLLEAGLVKCSCGKGVMAKTGEKHLMAPDRLSDKPR